jgi:hypothetical protein
MTAPGRSDCGASLLFAREILTTRSDRVRCVAVAIRKPTFLDGACADALSAFEDDRFESPGHVGARADGGGSRCIRQ